MLTLSIHIYVTASMLGRAVSGAALQVVRRARPDDRGQASAEYALVLLGAAAVALLIVAWATKTNVVAKLLDKVMKAITDKVR